MNKKLGSFFVVAIMATAGLQGCMATSQEVGSVAGSALTGAALGALGGAAISRKGDGRRSDAAVRGALGGLAAGAGYGLYQNQVNRERQYDREEAWAREQALRQGSTQCTSTKTVDAHGRVSVTERCTSGVSRPGYQNY